MILVFILLCFLQSLKFYNPAEVTGILIDGMAPDLSYDNTCSERLNFSGMK